MQSSLNSPAPAPRHPHVRTIHGEAVADDLFYLRDQEHPDTIPLLEAENAWTEAVTAAWKPLEDELYAEMVGRIQETDESVPYRDGDWWYYSRTVQALQYGIFCRKGADGVEQILLDSNKLAKGHDYFSLAFQEVSPDGRILAWATDTDGSEVYTLQFRNLETGEVMAGGVEGVYYSSCWASDSRTFFYTTLDETKRPWRVWRCVAGSAEPAVLVFEEPDQRFNVDIARSRSGEFLFLTVSSHTTSEVWRAPASGYGEFRLFEARKQDVEYYIEHQGSHFYMRTNGAARNFRLLRAPVEATDSWIEVIPHSREVSLEDVDGFAGHLVVTERRNGLRQLRIFDTSLTNEHYVTFDEPVYTFFDELNEEYGAGVFRFSYSSLTTPRTVFDYDLNNRSRTLLKRYAVHGGFDPSNYVSERLMATSHDGARVPVSVVRRRTTPVDGTAPLYLYGYGSYGIVTEPSFSSERISLLDRGCIYAIAHIRGSGDMGRFWYEDGKLWRKKNTFLDFVACASHLVDAKYTSPDRLAIAGGSAGGLLMGAVTNLRPDLFRAVVAHVPFVDVVNTMLDETLPLTVTEYEEWGNPNNHDDYRYIRSYAPYENVGSAAYPNMLVTAGLNDPRVPYWEPAKWVARLREKNTGDGVILLKTQMGAGHGGPSGRYEKLREKAFEYAFVMSMITPTAGRC